MVLPRVMVGPLIWSSTLSYPAERVPWWGIDLRGCIDYNLGWTGNGPKVVITMTCDARSQIKRPILPTAEMKP